MVKIIHGADFHLDSPFSGLSPQHSAQRRSELRQLPRRLADLARAEGADLVLLSGDLLDGQHIYRETAQALAEALGSIPCPAFLAPGNHDPWSQHSPYASLTWPDNVHIFSSQALESVDLPGLGCTVWGRAFCASHQASSPLEGLSLPRDRRLHLGCFHGDVAPQSDYGPISREAIAASGLTYLALGHIHQCSGLQREGDTFWAYPGCPEGRGFDETGEKGVLLVEAEPGQVKARFIPLCQRKYEVLSVDITGTSDLAGAVQRALPEDAQRHMFRVLLTGEGESPDLAALERTLAPLCYGLTLQDHTRLPQNLWQRREEDSLTGLFLRAMWEKCQAEPDNQLYQLCARYGLAALENGEEGCL